MSRCAICDQLDGHHSPTTPFINRSTSRTRWRARYNEFQCDDCYDVTSHTAYEQMDLKTKATGWCVEDNWFDNITEGEVPNIDPEYDATSDDEIKTNLGASAMPVREIE